MESLDDVIDAMIADRVIHRHRRKWLIAIAIVVILAVVIFFTGGWRKKEGRTVPTLTNLSGTATVGTAATVTAGRWEFSFSKAEIVRTPKDKYTQAKAELRVYFDLKNVDTEEHTSGSLNGKLLVLVPGGGKDVVDSNGADCRGEIGWVVVYGLPPESCFTKFDVAPDFAADMIEVGVLGESYDGDSGLLGANEDPYWHNEAPVAVVQLKPTVKVDTGEDK
ncbi:MAG TPA: hypothetical protein VFI00_23000 [Kribbella sp.]|nr:hypothetical protein [Kribbella sp.]